MGDGEAAFCAKRNLLCRATMEAGTEDTRENEEGGEYEEAGESDSSFLNAMMVTRGGALFRSSGGGEDWTVADTSSDVCVGVVLLGLENGILAWRSLWTKEMDDAPVDEETNEGDDDVATVLEACLV